MLIKILRRKSKFDAMIEEWNTDTRDMVVIMVVMVEVGVTHLLFLLN